MWKYYTRQHRLHETPPFQLSPVSLLSCTVARIVIGIGGVVTPLSPATPPYMRVRIRRFDKLVPPMNWRAERSQFGNAVRVSLLWSASFAASPRRAYQRPTEVGWLVHYPHRDPSTTDPSYRSGLRHGGDYYALC
jgi:hypothetical protein